MAQEITDDTGEDAELAALTTQATYDPEALRRLRDSDPEAAMELLQKQVAAQAEVNAKLIGRDKRRADVEYRTKLLEEFPYANSDLISGATRREMRASAERVHKHTEGIMKAAGIDPSKKADPVVKAPDARAEQWGTPPAGATEVVRGDSPPAWGDINRQALKGSGKQETKDAVMADIKANGPRRIERQTFTGIAGRKSEAART